MNSSYRAKKIISSLVWMAVVQFPHLHVDKFYCFTSHRVSPIAWRVKESLGGWEWIKNVLSPFLHYRIFTLLLLKEYNDTTLSRILAVLAEKNITFFHRKFESKFEEASACWSLVWKCWILVWKSIIWKKNQVGPLESIVLNHC